MRGAESLSEVDFQLLLDAARWFTVNTATRPDAKSPNIFAAPDSSSAAKVRPGHRCL
jgi:hypothetical protein